MNEFVAASQSADEITEQQSDIQLAGAPVVVEPSIPITDVSNREPLEISTGATDRASAGGTGAFQQSAGPSAESQSLTPPAVSPPPANAQLPRNVVTNATTTSCCASAVAQPQPMYTSLKGTAMTSCNPTSSGDDSRPSTTTTTAPSRSMGPTPQLGKEAEDMPLHPSLHDTVIINHAQPTPDLDQLPPKKSNLRQTRPLKLPPRSVTTFNSHPHSLPFSQHHLQNQPPFLKPEDHSLPDLTDLILALNLEIGFEPFFSSLVDVLDKNFLATRVSISIPNDPTDIISVPWTLKATWNKYFPLPASASKSREPSCDSNYSPLSREPTFSNSPYSILTASASLQTPHTHNTAQFAAHSWEEDDGFWVDDDGYQPPSHSTSPAQSDLSKSKSLSGTTAEPGTFPKTQGSPDSGLSRKQKFSLTRKLSRPKIKRMLSSKERKTRPPSETLSDAHNSTQGFHKPPLDADSSIHEVRSRPTSLHSPRTLGRHMKVFNKSSSLDYERHPLIDAQGVVYVLERNKTVLLQRRYSCSRDSCSPQRDDCEFIDSEQAINSPWAASPAPSPAVRDFNGGYFSNLTSNPSISPTRQVEEMEAAFSDEPDSVIDESSSPFSKKLSDSYTKPVHAIGCENMASIIHIPLTIPQSHPFDEEKKATSRENAAPIAILSIMSSLIPYPADLRSLLKDLTPHIATAYLKASIHSGLTAQLDALTKSSRHRRFGSTSLRPYTLSTSTTPTGVPPEQRQMSPEPKNKTRKFSFRRARHAYTHTKSVLQSKGASFMPEKDFVSSSSSLPHAEVSSASNYYHWRRTANGIEHAVPSNRLLRTIIDAIPIQVFTLEPISGDVTWVSNRTLAYRGLTAEEFFSNPHRSIHPDERNVFISSWTEALRKGEPLQRTVRMRRFDGRYRAVSMRAVPLRDDKGVIIHWLCSIMDIHQQRKAELERVRRVREAASDHKYKILADATPIIVFTVHPQKGVIYANKTWFNYSGCTNEETYVYEFINRIHPDDRKLCLSVFTPGLVDSPHPSVEVRLLAANNEYNWHLISYNSLAIDGEENETTLLCGTCTNINDQKMIQQKLQEAKEAAQRTIESKTRFLSNMSHEIRTPLIGISGMVSFLLDTKLSEEQLDYCHTISSSSDALLTVINDILDLSKVESGKMALTNSWFHVRRLVEEANEFLSSMAISKSLELNYIVESDVPVWVKGDRIRLRQVLLNVLGNAIKFTDRGEAFTRCSVVKAPDAAGTENQVMLKFEVIDTGRGFTAEDEHRMFKPFSQLKYNSHETNAAHSAGTGLGLVISRQLVQLHGGTLTCKGEKDKGSTFVFTCKVQLPSDEDAPSSEEKSKAANVSAGEVNSVDNNKELDILIICCYKYAAESIVHHICKTVADPTKCKCTVAKDDSGLYLPGHTWTHVIINVIDVGEAVGVANKVIALNKARELSTEIVMLSTPLQRPKILQGIDKDYRFWAKMTILYKPLKPSRYGLVFDPSKEREESQDMKMQIAQRVLENQKNIFKSIGSFAKDNLHRVLLVEDNLINQKVMEKFFVKSGLQCDVAEDGEDCVTKVFERGPHYYDLILVS